MSIRSENRRGRYMSLGVSATAKAEADDDWPVAQATADESIPG